MVRRVFLRTRARLSIPPVRPPETTIRTRPFRTNAPVKRLVLDAYGHCVTQAQCIKSAGQKSANQKQLAQDAFIKGYGSSVGTTLIVAGLLGCTAGEFAGGVAGMIAFELLTGTPFGAALGELTCLGGAADAVLVALPLTLLTSADQGGVQYFSAASAANNEFQQNIQNCYQ